MDDFFKKIDQYYQEQVLTTHYRDLLKEFFLSYQQALGFHGVAIQEVLGLFYQYLELLVGHLKDPFMFGSYHKKMTSPFNYHQFGIDFFKPLVDQEASGMLGDHNIPLMMKQLAAGHNVILLANHQSEADPQALKILLEGHYSQFGEDMIFVAGDRVISDPLAVPFSQGCNLICIYSKKHIHEPPHLKVEKQMHNKRTMQMMSSLLAEGGKCIYVAPSGGRDRVNDTGELAVAPFDPQSIEMFYLMAKRSGTPTHFYALSLLTFHLLPPPDIVQVELGEVRSASQKKVAVHAAFSAEVDMDNFSGSEPDNKLKQRNARGNYLWNVVNDNYQQLKQIDEAVAS